MQFTRPVMDKKMIPALAAIPAAALAAAVLLSLASIQFANRAIHDEFAAIIAVVSERYPEAEAEVVHIIQDADPALAAQGRDILSRYGLETTGFGENAVASSLAGWILPGSILLVLAVSAAFIGLLIRYQRTVDGQVAGLSEYLQHLGQGEYELDIRDNSEGALSLLKNNLYKITVRLREQAEMLKQDKVVLSDAIADISHQIKTPLTSLFVLVDLLAENPPEKDHHEFIGRMRLQLERIQWLIMALLKLSRLDAGTANLKYEKVDIESLIERALDPLHIPMELKMQQLIVTGDGRASFQGDMHWSAEALTNLIKNCVEHTPEGGRIEIAYGENPLYAEITITDNGEGISSDELPLIFQRFYRGKNASENSIGIGLALAKAIFLEQGGDITVTSQPGQGTQFSVKVFRGVV